jgi:hypothetical protein
MADDAAAATSTPSRFSSTHPCSDEMAMSCCAVQLVEQHVSSYALLLMTSVFNVQALSDALPRSPSMKPLPEAVSLMSLEAQQQV